MAGSSNKNDVRSRSAAVYACGFSSKKSGIATWEALKNPRSKNTSKSPAATGLGFELENLTQWGTRLQIATFTRGSRIEHRCLRCQTRASPLHQIYRPWFGPWCFRSDLNFTSNIFDFWLTTPLPYLGAGNPAWQDPWLRSCIKIGPPPCFCFLTSHAEAILLIIFKGFTN